jgi:hypothetical protein
MRAYVLIVLAGCGASAEHLDDADVGTSFKVGVQITGLAGSLALTNNGADRLDVTGDGMYTFSHQLGDGRAYHVAVATQPAGQTCTVSGGDGTIHGGDVDVAVNCSTRAFTIGGDLTGVVGTVVLDDNGNDQIALVHDGAFVFGTQLANNAAYAVTVAIQPPTAHCTVGNGSGHVANADVTSVAVACAPTYSVGGSVSGLAGGSITIQDNGGDDVVLAADGGFVFPTRLESLATYHVTATGPATQQCTIAHGDGAVANADITDVAITCVNAYTVGGTVTGLAAGTTLVLKDNGGDPKSITADGAFTFDTRVALGQPYAVTVGTPASGQLCTIASGSGTIAGDVGDVTVNCRPFGLVLDEVHVRVASGALGDANGDTVRDTTDDEFVEVLNNEASTVDISGWVVLTGVAPAVKFTFPANTLLAAGQRAVVFGGGTPAGGFGGALVFTAPAASGLALTDAPAAAFTVRLDSAAAAGITLDTFTYDATTFGSSCTTTCGSQTRSPSGTGPFVTHATAAGAAGILWSPGVAPTAAIPKLDTALSSPANNATNVSVTSPLTAQFNMLMNTATFDNTHLRLYASPCAALMNEVTSFSSIGPGTDASKATLVPSAALAYATVYCLTVDATTASAIGVPLVAAATIELTTHAAASSPAANVVISEVGGCRLSSTTGVNACGGANNANDEFVELYNPTAAAIDISGWFVQRRSAGGTASCSATLPAATTLAAGGFYLVGGAGYSAAHYPGAPAADLLTAGSLVVGGSESVVLITSAGTCTGSTGGVDAVSVGTITDTLATLELPAFPTTVTDGMSIERKACYDSTADASTTGMLPTGGHEPRGNAEHVGASNADWILRATPNPQNSASTAEPHDCVQ